MRTSLFQITLAAIAALMLQTATAGPYTPPALRGITYGYAPSCMLNPGSATTNGVPFDQCHPLIGTGQVMSSGGGSLVLLPGSWTTVWQGDGAIADINVSTYGVPASAKYLYVYTGSPDTTYKRPTIALAAFALPVSNAKNWMRISAGGAWKESSAFGSESYVPIINGHAYLTSEYQYVYAVRGYLNGG